MRRWSRIVTTACAVCLSGLWLACGPVVATTTVRDADLAIQQAELEGAEELAVYEYVSAVEYLDKAREEWGYSDYQHAEEYAERALDMARRARQRAIDSSQRSTFGEDIDELDDE